MTKNLATEDFGVPRVRHNRGGSGMEYTFGKLEVAGIEDYWAVFDGGKCVGDFDEYDEAMAFCVEYSGKTVTV